MPATETDREVARYLATGEHDDHLFRGWPGTNLVERAQNGTRALRDALVTSVARRAAKRAIPPIERVPMDLVRPRLRAMVHGLLPRPARKPALELLARSVVFVLPETIERLLRETSGLGTVWKLANMYLTSIGAEPLSRGQGEIIGMSEDKVAYVSLRYFTESTRFDDFVVHECAHVLHDTKLRDVGTPKRGREWLLEIEYRKRETFAYACEHYGAIASLGRGPRERRALLAEYLARGLPNDRRVDRDEYVDIIDEAVNARNGWARILARCSRS